MFSKLQSDRLLPSGRVDAEPAAVTHHPAPTVAAQFCTDGLLLTFHCWVGDSKVFKLFYSLVSGVVWYIII